MPSLAPANAVRRVRFAPDPTDTLPATRGGPDRPSIAEKMQAYVICKNEEPNIERSVRALVEADFPVTLLDSGSTDRTIEIARGLGAAVRAHDYESHCQTYNLITQGLDPGEWCVIVDADAVVSCDLAAEVRAHMEGGAAVTVAPVLNVHEGHEIPHASLYPPKPLAFRGGRAYFVPKGHGEALMDDVQTESTASRLRHDDRKPYEAFVLSQVRYGRKLAKRARSGPLTWRDKIRARFPLGIVLTPFVSYVLRGGFLDGRGGLIYALDRLIAESIFYRQVIAERAREARGDAGPDEPRDRSL